MKHVTVFILALMVASCAPEPFHLYRSSMFDPHVVSGVRTNMGKAYGENDDAIIVIPAKETDYVTHAERRCIIFASRPVSQQVRSNTNISRSVSISDTEALALNQVLSAIATENSPRLYYRFTSKQQRPVADISVSIDNSGNIAATSESILKTAWVSAVDISFYQGRGIMCVSDGSWSDSYTMKIEDVQHLKARISAALTDPVLLALH